MPLPTADPSRYRDGFVRRYLEGELDRFYPRPAGDLAGALVRPGVEDPDELADALRAQAQARGDRPEQLRAIERLRDPAARVVVTGQQAGVLLGPSFVLSKAATALRLARALDRPERPVVPVFWVASQDHDAAEIDHAVLLDEQERPTRLRLPLPAELPAGRMPWTAEYEATLQSGLRELATREGAWQEVQQLLARTSQADTVADRFARLLSDLLGEHGLIVADPMRPALARRFAPVLLQEARHAAAGTRSIAEAGEALKAAGERPQLGRAEDATNLFVQLAAHEPRRLLRTHEDTLVADGMPDTRWSVTDLAALLERDPCAVTPAAGLRPVTQDAAFPNVATVVGPGELRYFAQLSGLYDLHQVPPGLAWPRAQVTLLTPPVVRLLQRFDSDAAAFQQDPDGVECEAALRRHGYAERFGAAWRRLRSESEALIEAVEGLDPTLVGPVERARKALAVSQARLRSKTAAALARRDEVAAQQAARLRAQLLPFGAPQERTLSPFSYFLRYGVEAVVRRYLDAPVSGEVQLPLDSPD